MPFRRRRNRYGFNLRPVDSIKHIKYAVETPGIAVQQTVLAKAVDNPITATVTECKNGCTIKNMFISLDFCGLAGSGVSQTTTCYLMKNPGNNLVAPVPRTEGSSNEKKFIFKTWNYMTMRNQDGNPPYHWEGWIKIPRRYQRMGVDDQIILVFATDTAAGHLSVMALWKSYN